MKKPMAFLLLCCSLILPSQVLGWGTTGHRVIAEIAELNLDSKAKKGVKDLLDNQSMVYWANWADYIKSDTTDRWKHTYVWHFVNAPAGLSKSEFINSVKAIQQGNLYSEIVRLSAVMKDKTTSREDKQEALKFLIHLVGDMHQPMHVGRAEDLGGNKIPVMWFNDNTNLHSLWDSKLIDFEKYSYSEYTAVLNVLTKQQKAELQQGTIEDWLYETHQIANVLYDITPPNSKLSFDYNYRTKPIVELQLQRGGLHLAKLLNDLFK